MQLVIDGDEDRELEEWTVHAKSELLRDVFDLDVTIAGTATSARPATREPAAARGPAVESPERPLIAAGSASCAAADAASDCVRSSILGNRTDTRPKVNESEFVLRAYADALVSWSGLALVFVTAAPSRAVPDPRGAAEDMRRPRRAVTATPSTR